MKNTHRKSGFTLVELLVLLAIAGIVCTIGGSALIGCSRSDGARTGQVVQFSTTGMMVKSMEGELLLGGRDESGSGRWHFSVTDPEVARQVDQALSSGQVVRLNYTKGVFSGLSNTPYRVVKVVPVTPSK